jgi:hypothetical protein
VTATRLKHREFYADVICDWRDREPVWIYVVQRHGSPEILAMGSCNSQEEAIEYATEAIGQFRTKSASAS